MDSGDLTKIPSISGGQRFLTRIIFDCFGWNMGKK